MVENEVQQTNATVVTHRLKTLNPLGHLTIAYKPKTVDLVKSSPRALLLVMLTYRFRPNTARLS